MSIFEQHDLSSLVLPKAALVLQDVRGVPTFESAHGLRHPTGAYNLSLNALANRLIITHEQLENYTTELIYQRSTAGVEPSAQKLLEAIDHLLDALMEHFDVCQGILRCFFALEDKKRFDKVHSAFKSAIAPYRNHIGTIVNYIKHNQGALRFVHFRWGEVRSIGYYIEGPLEDNSLGPAKHIHPEAGAFSLNRDLTYHLCSVFAVGAQLANALHSVDRRLTPMPSTPVKNADNKESDWLKAVRLTSKLPNIFFPDEVKKPIPRIYFSNSKCFIEYPSTRRVVLSPSGPYHIDASFGGDGFTKTFRFPYLATDKHAL